LSNQIEIKHLPPPELALQCRKTVWYSWKDHLIPGKPLSRIEIYQSGANRIIGESTTPKCDIIPQREENDIKEFNHNTRRRYFYYINSLDLSEMKTVWFLTLSISTNIKEYLEKDVVKSIYRSFFKKIQNSGFDFTYKIEYTLQEMPHLHILAYSKNLHGWNNDIERVKIARQISSIWTDSVFDSIDFPIDQYFSSDIQKIYKNMCTVSCELDKPDDLVRLTYYFANYTSKNKDYQNIVPEKYFGTRFWGRRRKNYGNITNPPQIIGITREIFDNIYRMIHETWKEKRKERCKKKYNLECRLCKNVLNCVLYKKNGFYHNNIESVISLLEKSGKLHDVYEDYRFNEHRKLQASGFYSQLAIAKPDLKFQRKILYNPKFKKYKLFLKNLIKK